MKMILSFTIQLVLISAFSWNALGAFDPCKADPNGFDCTGQKNDSLSNSTLLKLRTEAFVVVGESHTCESYKRAKLDADKKAKDLCGADSAELVSQYKVISGSKESCWGNTDGYSVVAAAYICQ